MHTIYFIILCLYSWFDFQINEYLLALHDHTFVLNYYVAGYDYNLNNFYQFLNPKHVVLLALKDSGL